MGRLQRAASRLAVPDATSTTSAAISAVGCLTIDQLHVEAGAHSRKQPRKNLPRCSARHRRDEFQIGPLRGQPACATAAKSAARRATSPRRLPGSSATTLAFEIQAELAAERRSDPPFRVWHPRADGRRTRRECRAHRKSASRTAAGTAPDPPLGACCARVPAAMPTPADSRTAPWEFRRRANCAPILSSYPAHRCRRRHPDAPSGTFAGCARAASASRGRSRSTSNSPITASDSAGSQLSHPAACILGPATPKNFASGSQLAQRIDEIGAQGIARRFPRHQTHAQRCQPGASCARHYRTMLRSLRLMNSTKGRISAWVAAAFSSSSMAALSFSPERYSNR